MRPLKASSRPDTHYETDEIAWAKLRTAKVVWNLPTEDALGVLADMAVKIVRKTYEGEAALEAMRIYCDELLYAVEQAGATSEKD
jgi:hypothetical protein